ncbi:BamA/TamA family outer membrane protein [Cytophagaceae bacterium YF14B1]|uniref:BamA/TamA family outer membrane protein n=1 Tax=Xanthocytophaga flava TaxID=3048013 RepID=A0AAE3QNQ1_9BACT|nr:BamA/TamA family outer membrane protein [Xanthocytophaga flavus]MDJ1482046.1 BamA/TamA family outer membrane protein [Xanthocytophaga flavus]
MKSKPHTTHHQKDSVYLGLCKFLCSRSCLLVWIITITACTGTRFIPEGKYLYTGADLKFKHNGGIPNRSQLETEIEAVMKPAPNKSFLGMRPTVWFYYIAGTPKKKKGLRNFIKTKLGRPPVFLSDVSPERTSLNLKTVLQNNGYFEANVEFAVTKKSKTAAVDYTAYIITPPYRIRDIHYERLDSVYGNLSTGLPKESLLKTNDIYKLATLEKEIKRVAETVRDSGFYYFSSNYLIFNADSSVGKRQVDLYLGFENIPDQAKKVYRLDTITIVNQYQLTRDSTTRGKYATDTIEGYKYRYRRNDFRPEIILNSVNLHKDSLYRRIDHELTLSRLTDLGVFKFVNIRFTPKGDSLLRVRILLTPLLKKSLRFEVQINSKSNNFVGPAVTASFINRNFLKGAELFQFQINGAYEVQANAKQQSPVNAYELGSEASLTIPRFISPFHIPYSSHRYMPQTTMKVGFKLQNRVDYFLLNSLNIAYGYSWRETAKKNHTLYPADITFFQLGNISELFESRLQNDPYLQRSLRNQFILGSRYTFTYNSQTGEQDERKKDNIYFAGSLDFSGNLAYLTQRLAKSKENASDKAYEIAGRPYSQYSRADVDLRYYHDIDSKNQYAVRFIAGAGFAYGNATTMPYVKQFSSGGSNSIRAFRARSVGPGSFDIRTLQNTNTNYFIDQTGDIKLETNVEYRFGIIGYLKGAIFADAGNIWLVRSDTARPGGEFAWNRFYKEIAVGTGLGLRLDASFFVLRLDAAFPLRIPYLPENNRWVIQNVNIFNSRWRSNNLIFNIAIGYPF